MAKIIAPLANANVPVNTVFDRRLVIECCERFHIHWRNVRLELTPANWDGFVNTFEQAIATWRANGSPRQHEHLELARYLMDTNEIVHPTDVEVELTLETRDRDHCVEVLDALRRRGYEVERVR